MINNRQAGRRRGRGGGNGQRQGGGMQGNGSRIDNRARGNASQLLEKYKNMAADAQRAGDRVNTEYYLQFADHYFRVLSEQRGRVEEQQSRRQRDEFDYDGDDEFGEEGDPIRAGEQSDAARGDREFRGNREARNAPRDGQRDDGEARGDGARREWRDRPERPERAAQADRTDRGAAGGRGDARSEPVAGQHLAEPIAAGESVERRAEEVLEADRPLDPPARRRGRPRREPVEATADTAPALEADRLPPSLTVAANDEGDTPPRRRRTRRVSEETPTAAE